MGGPQGNRRTFVFHLPGLFCESSPRNESLTVDAVLEILSSGLIMPHTKSRSTRSKKNDRKNCVVLAPAIRVVIGKNSYGQETFAEAHLLTRRGCYNYLRWRDGNGIKEFYLGKLKNRATQRSSPAPAAAGEIRKKLCGTK